ncbi:transmembrane protein 26, partial [Asbolus verrucosus]
FCPSVFLYLASIVPAIWLLELDKVDRRLRVKEETFNLTSTTNLKEINSLIGVQIKLPDIPLSTETWITLIEQFLMLILIIGRWMLPKGDLTRDQLSQLLLVYIGTAADIIEFFDSFKDDKIASEPILVLLTSNSCCTIDVWGIALNITLQDAPFLVFRLLLITHFQIISYMNVFFTCKNTLVILLQLYRLYVVHSEHRKKRTKDDFELTNISIISKPDMYGGRRKGKSRNKVKKGHMKNHKMTKKLSEESEDSSDDLSDDYISNRKRYSLNNLVFAWDETLNSNRKLKNSRKDTGYSTGSSHTSAHIHKGRYKKTRSQSRESSKECPSSDSKKIAKQKLKRSDQETKGRRRLEEAFSEESESDLSPVEKKEEVKREKSKRRRSYEKEPTISLSTSDPSSE